MSERLKGNEHGAALTPQIKSVVEAAENYWIIKCAYVAEVAKFNSDLKDMRQMNLATAALLHAEAMLCQAVDAYQFESSQKQE